LSIGAVCGNRGDWISLSGRDPSSSSSARFFRENRFHERQLSAAAQVISLIHLDNTWPRAKTIYFESVMERRPEKQDVLARRSRVVLVQRIMPGLRHVHVQAILVMDARIHQLAYFSLFYYPYLYFFRSNHAYMLLTRWDQKKLYHQTRSCNHRIQRQHLWFYKNNQQPTKYQYGDTYQSACTHQVARRGPAGMRSPS
jgi:hypothetical protein